MPYEFPPTPLDLHNDRERAVEAVASNDAFSVPSTRISPFTLPDDGEELDLLADAVARKRYGLSIYFGGSENAAADALKLLEGYVAILNGDQYVWIDDVDLGDWVLRGVRSEANSNKRFEDQPFAISLREIKSISV